MNELRNLTVVVTGIVHIVAALASGLAQISLLIVPIGVLTILLGVGLYRWRWPAYPSFILTLLSSNIAYGYLGWSASQIPDVITGILLFINLFASILLFVTLWGPAQPATSE